MTETSSKPPAEYGRVRSEVTDLLALDGEAFTTASEGFLEARLAELTAEGHDEELMYHDGNIKGFIHSETQIFPQAIGKGYRLDDETLYSEALPHMRSVYPRILHQVQDPDKAYVNAALMAAQLTQQSYFGGVHNGHGAMERRDFLLGDFTELEAIPGVRSISEFKGVAMCAERAAVANNVLQLLGMRPVLEMGTLQIDDRPTELHAYLFVRSPSGQEVVYDPTNPTLVFDANDRLLQASPAFYPAGDALTTRDASLPITGVHKTYEFDGRAKHVIEEAVCRFTTSGFGQELHPE